jgi:mono/diheme cytochrome c family protein
MRSMIVVTVLALSSCTTIESHPIDEPTLSPAERAWQDNVFPMLVSTCGGCHRYNEVAFLDGDTVWGVRDTLVSSAVVNLDDPYQSRLISHGPHSGPAMTPEQVAIVVDWLTAERAER